MDAILGNTRYRNLFFIASVSFLAVLILLRYLLLPRWNPGLSLKTTEALAQLAQGLTTSLVATILIGSFIFFVTPAVMRKAKIEPVDPKSINPLLKKASSESLNWIFRGGMGRYTRAETIPALIKRARESGLRRKITLMLSDPDDERACQGYALYRNGLSSASKAKELTASSVRDQILATIFTAAMASLTESMLDVELFVLPIWSVVRIDLSDRYVIVTSEDDREPGLRADEETHYYGTYRKDLDFLAKQGRRLPHLDGFCGLQVNTAADLLPLMKKLELVHDDVDALRLDGIWSLMMGKSHQYA